ncbi:MAG: hypothetical protein J3K34DRAFT_160676 [Monoraphidium minutum]|nr:MAG: hypothetical protein J3K34DRAFT_160676 [Monoraphidium minutum]
MCLWPPRPCAGGAPGGCARDPFRVEARPALQRPAGRARGGAVKGTPRHRLSRRLPRRRGLGALVAGRRAWIFSEGIRKLKRCNPCNAAELTACTHAQAARSGGALRACKGPGLDAARGERGGGWHPKRARSGRARQQGHQVQGRVKCVWAS